MAQLTAKVVGRVLFQGVSALNLLPRPSVYEHKRPTAVNEIWVEDFTKVSVLGFNYPVAVVEDVFSTKYLGRCVQLSANSQLVGQPVAMDVTDKRKKLLEKVALSVTESIRILNEELPRPAFGGLTPSDVHAGIGAEKKMAKVEYLKNEQIKENGGHWSKSKYDLAKEVLEQMHFSKKELLIKHCFFQKAAFRRIGNLPSDGWTN